MEGQEEEEVELKAGGARTAAVDAARTAKTCRRRWAGFTWSIADREGAVAAAAEAKNAVAGR